MVTTFRYRLFLGDFAGNYRHMANRREGKTKWAAFPNLKFYIWKRVPGVLLDPGVVDKLYNRRTEWGFGSRNLRSKACDPVP